MHTTDEPKALTFRVPTATDKGFIKFFEKIMVLAEKLERIKGAKSGTEAFAMIRDVISVLRQYIVSDDADDVVGDMSLLDLQGALKQLMDAAMSGGLEGEEKKASKKVSR